MENAKIYTAANQLEAQTAEITQIGDALAQYARLGKTAPRTIINLRTKLQLALAALNDLDVLQKEQAQ